MRTLQQEVNLVGKIEHITMTDLRKTPGEIFACVQLGKVFIVTHKRKEIAVISKPPGETLTLQVQSNGLKRYVL